MTFLLLENSGLVYTPRQLHVVFGYKLNLLRPDRENYTNLKEVYSVEFSKESSVSWTHETLPKAKFLRVNQQLKQEINRKKV